MEKLKICGGTVVVIFVLVSGTSNASGQNTEKLSLEEAITFALQNHPRIERAQYEIEAAEAGERGARSRYYPWVDVEGVLKDGLAGALGGLDFDGLPGSPFFNKAAVAVNLGFTAYDFGRTGNQVEEAGFTAASLRSRVAAVRATVVWMVKAAYYRCLQAEELRRVAQEIVEERRLTARQAQVYYDAMLRSKLDANLARANVIEAEAELARAENRKRLAYAALNQAMGVTGRADYQLEPVRVDWEVSESTEGMLERALAHRPDLQALSLEVQAVEAALDAARSERYPRLLAVASVGKARFAEDLDGQNWVVGVGVSVPVFTGFALESQIDRARANMLAAEANRKELLQKVRYEVERATLDLDTARAMARAAEARVSLSEEALRLATQRYGAQLGSFLDLREAEVALAKSKQEQVVAMYDFLIGTSTLELVVGETTTLDSESR